MSSGDNTHARRIAEQLRIADRELSGGVEWCDCGESPESTPGGRQYCPACGVVDPDEARPETTLDVGADLTYSSHGGAL